jgi:glycosyltransferase involved in cell wall biosynthesis
VAFDSAGGVTESISHGETGLIAQSDDLADFVAHTRRLLTDHGLRERLGAQAAIQAKRYSWDQAVLAFQSAVQAAVDEAAARAGRRSAATESRGQREP